tara:strand:- start:491 stop:751 length:261 start_codon:yes stop_codon:yes gene_type:complete
LNLDHHRKLIAAQLETLTKLERSLALERRFPGCFDSGTCKVRPASKYPHKYPEDFTLTVGGITVDGRVEPETLIEILGPAVPARAN